MIYNVRKIRNGRDSSLTVSTLTERNIAVTLLKAVSMFVLTRYIVGKGSVLHKNLIFIDRVFAVIKQP